jgi:hypothetical protein
MLDRLSKKHVPKVPDNFDVASVQSTSNQMRTRASSVGSFNQEKCMFCQLSNKARLYNIACLETSASIPKDAASHYHMRVRLANITDLVAAEGKDHLKCLQSFRREVTHTFRSEASSSKALAWLLDELQYAAGQAQSISLSSVWDRYQILSAEANEQIPQHYISRRSHFK